MMMRAAVLLPAALAGAAGPAAGQDHRTPVQVEFRLEEETWADLFTADQLAGLERDVAALLARSLGERLPVLELTTDSAADYRVVFTLGPRGGPQANLHQADRGFHARLVGPDSSTDATWWTLFRSAAQLGEPFGGSAGVPLSERFLDHVRAAVRLAEVDPLVRDHFSRVPITGEGRIWTPPPGKFGWVAPMERDSLCLALDSGLRVLVLVPSELSGQLRPRIYQARLDDDFDPAVVFGGAPPPEFAFGRGFFLRPDPVDQPELDRLEANPGARVAAFYVVEFEEDATLCGGLPTPIEAETAGGGGGDA